MPFPTTRVRGDSTAICCRLARLLTCLYNCVHGQLCVCVCVCVCVSTDIYTNIFAQPTAVQAALAKPGKERSSDDIHAITHMLRVLDFFRTMKPRQQNRFCRVRYTNVQGRIARGGCAVLTMRAWFALGQIIRYRKYNSGDYICKQGDEQGDFYILMSGILLVKIKVRWHTAVLATVSYFS